MLTERFPLRSFLALQGKRYRVLSDRLGQSLKLSEGTEEGTIHFTWKMADESAFIESLEGSLRDESGMIVAVRSTESSIQVPVGRYALCNLVLQVRDSEGHLWRMTLANWESKDWIEVKSGESTELPLLASLHFKLNPEHSSTPGWDNSLTHLQPVLSTKNGLVVTNFTCDDPERKTYTGESVIAKFNVLRGNGKEFNAPEPSCSSYG